MQPLETKTCRRCGEPKPLDEFGYNAYYERTGARDGRNPCCMVCVAKKACENREVLREKYNAEQRARRRALDAQRTSAVIGELTDSPERVLQHDFKAELSFPELMAMAQGHKNFGRDVFKVEVGHE